MSPAPPSLDDLRRSPNALARHYARFRVAERLLLTGHSHQAWPDAGFAGQMAAWTDAAEHVDDKWERASAQAEHVRRGFARWLGAAPGEEDTRAREIALGQNTHELVARFLSALPLARRPRLVTTDGEFHTIRRQLDRLVETEWCEVVKVAAEPADLAGRLARAVNDRTAAVLVSSVLFRTARIVPGLGALLAACRARGAELLIDAYHHLNVVPFSLEGDGLADAFVVGGGYKYAQLGEGNCFLRVPPGRESLRPVLTGWFSEFARLSQRGDGVPYGEAEARWAGATYDPTSHYRAAEVFEFFAQRGLTPGFLRDVSQHQVGLLASEFDRLDLDPAAVTRDRATPLAAFAGFLALTCRRAGEVSARLRQRGVSTDHRDDVLRLGPAPYLNDDQLRAAIAALGEAIAGPREGRSGRQP